MVALSNGNSLFTKDQAIALGVKVIGIAGSALVTRGVMTTDQVSVLQTGLPAVIGFAGVLYALVYSLWANRKSKQIAKVAAMPEVDQIAVNSRDLISKVAAVDPTSKSTISTSVVS